MSFIKRKENFTCEQCESAVTGSGYTNHCPHCLTSKHVDADFPGDRAATCLGLMDAVGIKLVGGQAYKIFFQCRKCPKTIYNQISELDNKDLIVKLPIL